MNTTEITIDGRQFVINLAEATRLGLIEPKKVKRRLSIKDIPNGTLFTDCPDNRYRRFVMLNNQLQTTGQLITVVGSSAGEKGGFNLGYNDRVYSYWDEDKVQWISEIEE